MPGHDQAIELQDPGLQHPQLGTKSGNTRPRQVGEAFIIRIGHNIEQVFDTLAPHRRNDSEFGKMGTDRVDHRRLLADEEMARAMQHQAALLLRRLGLDEPHVCP
ncbi:MAG: hypothetical protein ACREV8_14345, partial [Gammaproteobacteria bacterium]